MQENRLGCDEAHQLLTAMSVCADSCTGPYPASAQTGWPWWLVAQRELERDCWRWPIPGWTKGSESMQPSLEVQHVNSIMHGLLSLLWTCKQPAGAACSCC
jgi:hypothetical protein